MARHYLPMEWEERWRRDKEQRRRVMEEGGEEIEEVNRKLRWIVAYNDTRMGLRRKDEEEGKAERRNDSTSSKEGEEDEEGQSEGPEEEEKVLMYSRDRYPGELFQTLEELRDSSLLTDLTLSTEDGLSLHVHSPVLAAVSSLVHHRLQERDGRRERRSVDMDTQREVSMVLGPDVGRVGLAGVLEFAYTGAIAALNRDNVVQIQAAAHALGVPRVLELCRQVEEEVKEGGGRKTEERTISAVEQMKISLQSIRQLWTQRVGCDVILEVEGTSFHGG